jgi:hypothetical protein
MTLPVQAPRAVHFWLLLMLVGVLPFVVYAPAITERYGFRDDYSTLREAQDSLQTTRVFCASQGRPLYGIFLGYVSRWAGTVDNLVYLRALGIGLTSAVALLLTWTLYRRVGLSLEMSAGLGLLAIMLPSAQVRVGWAICGPHVIGAFLGLAAFVVADLPGSGRRLATLGAVLLVVTGAFFYQSDVMLYLVPVVAAGVFHTNRHDWRWAVRHGAILFGGLMVAFLMTKALFALEVFPASRRVALETQPWSKLLWYAQNNARQALGLFVLRDAGGRTAPWSLAVTLLGVILAGWGAATAVRKGRVAGGNWIGAAACGLLLAGSVSLIASERWPTYRTIWALAIVVLLLVLRPLAELSVVWRRALLVMIAVPVAALAQWNVRHLFVEPQQAELARIEKAAQRVAAFKAPRVLLILQNAAASTAPLRWLDEFGSNSTDCEWSPKEMLRMALRARGAAGVVAERGLRLKSSLERPKDTSAYDVVIDLRGGGSP